MNEETALVKCEIELDRIFFPKGVFSVNSGEFAIFSANVVKEIENCEQLESSWGKKTIKLKGNVCKLESYITYKVTCRLVDRHEVYGDTYEILFISKSVDLSNKSKQIDFLEAIINPNTVYKLFEKFDNVIELLENRDIQALTSIKGIGNATAMRIIQEYQESKDYSEIYTELSNLTLTPNMIKRLLDYYGSPTVIVDKIKKNPYDLVEVDGIGFKKADEIANAMGIKQTDKRRIEASVMHILNENGEKGKSYLHYTELMNLVYNQIGFIEESTIKKVAQNLIEKEIIKLSNNNEFIGLKRYYDLELSIYNELMRLLESPSKVVIKNDWKNIITNVQIEQGFEFTDEQFEAIKLILNENVVALSGKAGTGKTSSINGTVKVLIDYIIKATALSGKASVRITEATGLEASTIHKLLGYMNGEFMFNEKNKLDVDVVIIDESTMVNGNMMLSLLKAIPDGAKLIMIGDDRQLTPIGNCQVFNDILETNKIPKIEITKIHRQAEESGIIPTSIKITNQEQLFKGNYEGNTVLGKLQDMELDIYKEDKLPSDRVINHFLKHYEKSGNLMETQVLSPLRLRGDLSTYNLNTKIQSIINPVKDTDIFVEIKLDKDSFYKLKLGDKVINTKNNYKTTNIEGNVTPVFNGNMGIITEIDNGSCVVDFIGIGKLIMDREAMMNLELGYAITIHKSQGSGFHTAIVAIESAAFVLLNAELLYTGITRAKKYCVLVAQNKAVRMAINKREINHKQTYLKHFLAS